MKSIVEFKEIHGNNYPSIQTLISSTEDEYKLKIIDYLKKGRHIAESPSRVTDFITKKPLKMALSMQSDGVYSWRSDFVYYYENYNIKLKPEFINHVLSK